MRKAPYYAGKLCDTMEDAYAWLEHKRDTLPTDEEYTYRCKWNDNHDMWHATVNCHRDEGGYL